MNTPSAGHNRALNVPSKEVIVELLRELTAELANAAQENIICADERSEVVDNETAGKAVQLEATLLEIYQDLNTLRLEIKRPLMEGASTVDSYFHTITLPLIGPNPEKKREGAVGDLHARIDAWDTRRRAEIEAERVRLEAEALALQEAAEKADSERLIALEQGKEMADPIVQATLYRQAAEAGEAARKLADEASKTAAAATAQVARPIDSGVGPKATRRSNWQPQITHLSAAVIHCLTIPHARALIEQLVLRIYGAQVRAGARDTRDAEGRVVPGLPGALIIDQAKLTVRRK